MGILKKNHVLQLIWPRMTGHNRHIHILYICVYIYIYYTNISYIFLHRSLHSSKVPLIPSEASPWSAKWKKPIYMYVNHVNPKVYLPKFTAFYIVQSMRIVCEWTWVNDLLKMSDKSTNSTGHFIFLQFF